MKKKVFQFEDFEILEALGRKERIVDWHRLHGLYDGKRIMVTGGAGSIGSELVKTLLKLDVKSVIAVDFNEYGIFKLMRVDDRLKPVLFNLRFPPEFDNVDIVIHASAYKHAPMSELFPFEYYSNNVDGFVNVRGFAKKCGAKFILVSTDKAINPSSVMGKTKKACEDANDCGHSVRFGNVLQSIGSVVPTFLEQIQEGRKLTITHPEIKRYFMSKKEAVCLILESLEIGGIGDIFALDMGEQIKIVDLAKALFKLTGIDTGIEYIGLRPTEKLEEELYYKDCEKTSIEGIFKIKKS